MCRLKLYSLHSQYQEEKCHLPHASHERADLALSNVQSRFTHVSLNYCSVDRVELLRIFHGSGVAGSLRRLNLEGPKDLSHTDLVDLLRLVGSGLECLEVHDFSHTMGEPDVPNGHALVTEYDFVDRILEECPNLRTLDFIQAPGSPGLLDHLQKSRLDRWRFACSESVRSVHCP